MRLSVSAQIGAQVGELGEAFGAVGAATLYFLFLLARMQTPATSAVALAGEILAADCTRERGIVSVRAQIV